MKPLIKWSGSKRDEITHILPYIPKEYDTYLEPFIGGGALYFHLNPLRAVISDVHSELIAFYRAIKNGGSEKIIGFMESVKNDDMTYYMVRDNMKPTNDLDFAKRFYYLRKTCFRGMLRYNSRGGFNIPFGRYKAISYSELENKAYEALLKRTEIFNEDFSYVFEKYNSSDNFMFLDPPYDCEFTDYGYCRFGKEEHKKLAKYFKETKIKCLMVIGRTAFIEELYAGFIKNYIRKTIGLEFTAVV